LIKLDHFLDTFWPTLALLATAAGAASRLRDPGEPGLRHSRGGREGDAGRVEYAWQKAGVPGWSGVPLFELVFAAAIIYLPPLQAIFGTNALGVRELALLAPFPLVVWGTDELRRWTRRRGRGGPGPN
jgi:hypothetical protein